MNTFSAVEKVLAFHHTTTSSPLMLGNLVKMANTTTPETLELLASWPMGYKITKTRSHEFVEASETPMNLGDRKQRYLRQHIAVSPEQKLACTETLKKSKLQAPKVMKKKIERKPRMTMDEILQRALKKQAEKGLVAEKSRQIKHEFLGSQVPVVEGILRSLSGLSRSFSLSEIIRKVQSSSKCPLEAQEVIDVLERIDFCKVIDAGGIKFVELGPPMVKQEPAIKSEQPVSIGVRA